MDAKKDFIWLVLIFIGFGILWYLGGGDNSKNSNLRDGKFINMGGLFADRGETKGEKASNELDIAEDIKDIERELEQIDREIDKMRKKENRSPLYGKFSLNTGGAKEGYSEEYVSIKVSSSFDEKVPITGFELYSPITGKYAKITGAVEIPRSNEQNIEVPIMASPGDTLYIYTGYSPVGYSFRTNMCTGYFSQFQKFSPSLKKNCPTAEEEAETLQAEKALEYQCLQFLDDIPRCEIPKKLNDAPSYDCKVFATSNMSYNSCVANHFRDTDFPGTEWRVFLRSNNELWKNKREMIQLLDQNGKVIDGIDFN